MDPGVLYNVVFPTLIRKDAVFFAITTMAGSGNFFSYLMDKKLENGKPVFNVLRIINACKKCLREKRGNSCGHKRMLRWMSSDTDMLKALMSDNQEAFERETLGMDVEDTISSAFKSESIEYLLDPRTNSVDIRNPKQVQYIYLAVDPACGGKTSAYCCISTVKIARNIVDNYQINDKENQYQQNSVKYDDVIVGAEQSTSNSPDEVYPVIRQHIENLQRIYTNARIVLIPENNLAWEAQHLTKYLRKCKLRDVIIYSHKPGYQGIRTDHRLKQLMAKNLQDKFNERSLKFCSKGFISSTNDIENDNNNIPKEIIKQAQNYKQERRQSSRNPAEYPAIFLSGKRGGKDDLIICIQLNLLAGNIFLKNTKLHMPLLSHMKNNLR